MSKIKEEDLDGYKIPKHVAIIMDGNGRWAKKRFLPRFIGHKKGLDALEKIVESSINIGIETLTVFAFSTENWKRPMEEINFLMSLFLKSLNHKVQILHKNNIKLKIIGSLDKFSEEIINSIKAGEKLTSNNNRFTLVIAVNYGGRWDIVNAVNKLIDNGYKHVREEDISNNLSLFDNPEPDLFIRTGGEMRVSNFLLWQMAYTEFYFTDTLWPDFNYNALIESIKSYQQRERRFGRTSEQLPENERRRL